MGRIRLLEHDPELGAGLNPLSFARARERCTADRIVAERRSEWPQGVDPREQAEEIGVLVLRGTLLHRVRLAGRNTLELLGPGDVVRPWPGPEDFAELLNPGRWELLDDLELAGLDRIFLHQAAPWPELSVALAQRLERRLRSTLLRLAAAQIPRVETRLRVVLWDLADRFGKVDREGVLLPIRLHQDVMAGLVCTSRETVGRKLGELQQRGALTRDRRGWRLLQGPPRELFMLSDPVRISADL